jgi:hypothetical protein
VTETTFKSKNSAKLWSGAVQGDVKRLAESPFRQHLPQIDYIFIFPFDEFSENGVLTRRERAFYSRYSIHVPCNIGATSVSNALNLGEV